MTEYLLQQETAKPWKLLNAMQRWLIIYLKLEWELQFIECLQILTAFKNFNGVWSHKVVEYENVFPDW